MGSPLSPVLAEIFMSNFEEKLFAKKNEIIKNVLFWTRYVDDIFCIWTGTDRQLDVFLKFLNTINKKIQFTLEKEKDGVLHFLDLSMSVKNSKIDFEIYRKPTQSDVTIPASSNQSLQIKHSVFYSLINRLINIPLRKESFEKELTTIKQIAFNNGYDTKIVDQILKKQYKIRIQRMLYNANINEKEHIFAAVNYVKGVSVCVKNRLNRLGIKAIEVNKCNLGGLLVNNKPKSNKLNKNGIYQIKCMQCDMIYIGQSGRAIKNRIKEHVANINSNKSTTGFADHCIRNNHHLDENDVKILHCERKGKKLNLLELLEIKKAQHQKKHLANTQIEIPTSSTPLILPKL